MRRFGSMGAAAKELLGNFERSYRKSNPPPPATDAE